MRRRKLLIGLGALSAGGSAAFGTEAFTSAQAERNVDVSVAGDRSSFIAIQPLSSDNAGKYVDTESDQTVELELDGDNGGPGEGVANDAITQIEDLFRVVNQGSQPVSVYFEDDSEAVTFRVSQSTTSLEGPANSAELAVGEQVVVGMTVDTLNNDVGGTILDSVVLYADADPSAPKQSVPQPQYVVTPNPDANEFGDVQSAIDEAEPNSVIGIDGAFSGSGSESPLSITSAINADTEGITLTGFDGTPEIDATGSNLDTRDGGIVQIEADGVTLQNFDLTYADDRDDGATNGIEIGNGASVSTATIDGLGVTNDVSKGEVDQNGAINLETGDDLTVTNCTVEGGAISTAAFSNADVEVTISGNYVDLNPADDTRAPQGGPTEGIFAFGGEISSGVLEIRDNEVVNTPTNEEDIKVVQGQPATLNGEADLTSQVESLTRENDVSQVQVNGEFGSKVTPQDIGSGSRLASVSDVLKPDSAETSRTSAVVALFEEDGTYGPYTQSEDPDSDIGLLDRDDTLIQGLSGTPTIEVGIAGLRNPDAALSFQGNNTTVESVRFEISETSNIAKLNGKEPVVDIGGKGAVFNSVDIIAARPFNSEAGYARVGAGPDGSNSFSDGSVTFDGCTFALRNADGTFPEASDADSNGQAFLGGNPLFGGTGNTLEVVNSTFKGGIKLDCNLDDSSNTMRIEDCVFEEEAVDETIGGGVDSGSLTVANNDFRYALTGNLDIALFNDSTSATINGESGLNEQQVANRLANANEADTGGRDGRTPKVIVDKTGDFISDTVE